MQNLNKWQVYIIKTKSGKLYTGITTNLERRLNEHKSNKGAKYFRSEKPSEVVYVEYRKNRSEATKREIEIKKLSRIEKIRLISVIPTKVGIQYNNRVLPGLPSQAG